ncbi:hypothetical protein L218DRAFT_589916 [Marasmius fiardii PR-910]|nr:hypothetical protein L218DRAFT_589916 [Marasmius fiardii PR-910]
MAFLQSVLGPLLIGVFFNVALWGILVVQTMVYFQAYKRDTILLRFFVLYLFVVETVNSGLNIAMMYDSLVTEWGSETATTYFPKCLCYLLCLYESLKKVLSSVLMTVPILTVLISTPCQIFVAYRIRIISQIMWIPIMIVLLAFISMAGGLWTAVTNRIIKVFSRLAALHTPALMWLLASAIADLAITVSLYWTLARRKTGFRQTDDIINRILRLTVQTGLITTTFAMLDVICFLALPHTTVNFIWDLALSKLYTNALLSTFNARRGWNSLAGRTMCYSVQTSNPSPKGRLSFEIGAEVSVV